MPPTACGVRVGAMASDEEKKAVEGGPVYDWQGPCFAAMRERDPAKIPEQLRKANEAIQMRLSRLEPWPDGREMTALNEAVQGLREVRTRFMIDGV
jgi:hypothetical protein